MSLFSKKVECSFKGAVSHFSHFADFRHFDSLKKKLLAYKDFSEILNVKNDHRKCL